MLAHVADHRTSRRGGERTPGTCRMSSAAEALLLACVHRDPQQLLAATLPAPDSAVWDDLVALAGRQRVRTLVHRRLAAARGMPWSNIIMSC